MRTKVQSFYLVDYIKNDCNDPKRVILLLHGFGETGQKIYKRFKDFLPSDSIVIAPNGPFPLPTQSEVELKFSFAWYFFDNKTGEFFIDYDLPSELLKNLYNQFELKNLPLTIIGYSQGGYLAPFVGEKLSQTIQVIGINCRFRYDKLKEKLKFRLDGIHGEIDQTVDPIRAKESFEVLRNRGTDGSFFILENEGHKLTDVIKEKIREILI